MSKMKSYLYHNLIAIDQLFNALTGGAADETFSSRCYRGAVLAEKPKKRWRFWYAFVNGLFFDKNHCKTAYESEIKRKQYPPEFTEIT
ncbi:TPA: hypothetical protein PWY45_002426 [Mannheimia haemolytica]|uniref:DNA helicase UvrD n=3 Tax=root TaxID=1 RepID=A0A0M3LSB3_9CAUD|nr:hypothetical protein [Mannheimia haemolytica]YP_009207776.1 hypothetical protein AVV63_gp23 [Mannheimia phage vB_MhM_587AP1]YP_009785008.1 hypothetical protein HOR01_gp23 [Mannheimia phage vB_MhM_1127AP1]AJA72947.1 hypothetical protein 587AP1_23 [Mannheimia phage vB_MhM_587AP1]AJA73075.1 hypothetical protein 1127AP1_23 [Mannheimia phage vB_MhM_1127AP1]KYL19030.1 hypothetical protein AC571_00050 [Mannheimia haemolytica]KYL20991.1 hypothetical protein AC574_12020 [Mannheimia haemolytica]MDW